MQDISWGFGWEGGRESCTSATDLFPHPGLRRQPPLQLALALQLGFELRLEHFPGLGPHVLHLLHQLLALGFALALLFGLRK